MNESKADGTRRDIAKILGAEPVKDSEGNWVWSKAGKAAVILRPDPLFVKIEPSFPGTPDQHDKLRELCINAPIDSSFGNGMGLRT
jgi:hypothetical protein